MQSERVAPEKSVLGPPLSEQDHAEWTTAFESGRRWLDAGQFQQAVSDLDRAARLAPLHAETDFLLGKAYEGLEKWDKARQSYRLACDKDAHPIRCLSWVNEAIRDIAAEESALLVDMDQVFARRSEHGLVGFNLVEDYVHPTLEGHQLIAWELWQAIERTG